MCLGCDANHSPPYSAEVKNKNKYEVHLLYSPKHLRDNGFY